MAGLTEKTTPPGRRVYRVTPDSNAAIIVDDDRIVLMGDKDHFIVIDKNGTSIRGPYSVIAGSESNRRAGFWTTQPDFIAMFPSTIVTPIPTQIPNPPTAGISNLKDTMLMMTSLLG